jgi:hypothetical protein
MRWFLLLLALIVGFAQSQPSHDRAVAQEQQKSKQGKPDIDKRSVSDNKPKAKSEKKSSKQSDEHAQEKLQLDRKVVEYTEQLAVYTGKVQRYTFWLVVATVVLGLLGLGTALLAIKEFVTANRPKIVVRRFQLSLPAEGQRPVVEFVVANEGITDAIIGEHNFTALVLTTEDLQKLEKRSFPLYQQPSRILRRVYHPTFRLAHAIHLTGFEDEIAAFKAVTEGTAHLVAFGFIHYRDRMYGQYQTRFYRTYTMGERFLRASDDPDYDDTGQHKT